MKQGRVLFIALVLLAGVLTLAYLNFLRAPPPEANANRTILPSIPTDDLKPPGDAGGGLPPPQTPPEPKMSPPDEPGVTSTEPLTRKNFASALTQCRPEMQARTLGHLLQQVRESGEVKEREYEWQNLLYRTREGVERRLRREYDSTNKKPPEIRYYSVDDEGLPVPEILTDEQKRWALDPKVFAEKMGLEPANSQSAERLVLKDGSEILVEFDAARGAEGQIVDFQWRGAAGSGKGTLLCTEATCRCGN